MILAVLRMIDAGDAPGRRQAYRRSGPPNESADLEASCPSSIPMFCRTSRRSTPSTATMLAEHVCAGFECRIRGRSFVAGEADGVDGFIEALARLRVESRSVDIAPTAVLAGDDNLIACARVTAERRGWAGRPNPVEHEERLMSTQTLVEQGVWR